MEFPDRETLAPLLDEVTVPAFADVTYDPPAPSVDDPAAEADAALDALDVDALEAGATVAVGLGSRGIDAIDEVGRAVVDGVRERGFEPVVVPAMGSHGGATAEGQRDTLASLGLTEEALGCPIDARMDTRILGEGDCGLPVAFAEAALEADAVLVVNRVKPHTNFTGETESGLAKMLAIGLAKQRGARAVHEYALEEGYVTAITDALAVIRQEATVLGGVALVENFYDRLAHVEGVPADRLLEREPALLEQAREWMPTLPFDDLDLLVVDEIGKDVSGAGMDTNVVGRYRVLNAEGPETPDISRIYVRGLTEATHGNGNGIGLADLTRREVADELDLEQVYANALTSNSLSKAALPVVLPDDELALRAALTSMGPYDPERVRVAWIRDTGHLSEFRVSAGLLSAVRDHDDLTVGERRELTFADGEARFA